MPIVNLNRIYHVESQERKPVLNPVNVPDAAGAFLRGAVPAAGSAMPGLKARLADTEARYRERAGNDRAKWAAIGQLIGVGKDVGLAYAGAVERRDEADLNALQAAYTDWMNNGAEEAWNRPYKRGGDSGAKGDGPLVAIHDLDRGFDGGEAYKGARSGVREKFDQWRARASQRYFSAAANRQTQMAEKFRANALLAKREALDGEVKKFYDPNDDIQFKDAALAASEWRAGLKMKEAGLGDFDEQDRFHLFGEEGAGEYERLKNAISTDYLVERAEYYLDRIATEVGDTSLMEQAVEDLTTGPDAKTLCPDARIRSSLKRGLDAARIKKGQAAERLEALHQQERIAEVDDAHSRIVFDVTENYDLERERAAALSKIADLPDRVRLPLEAKINDAVETRFAHDYVAEYVRTANDQNLDPVAKRAKLDVMMQGVAVMPEGARKTAIMNQLFPPQVDDDKRFTKKNASALLSRGAPPSEVMASAVRAYKDGAMTDEDFEDAKELCKKTMTYSAATKGMTTEYNSAIYGALNDAFGVSFGDLVKLDKDGIPVADENGRLVLSDSARSSYSTGIDSRTGESFVNPVGFWAQLFGGARAQWQKAKEEEKRLVISAETADEAFRLGVAHVIWRMNGGGDKKDGIVSPETIRSELAEIFRSHLSSAENLTDLVVQDAIQRARVEAERFGVPEDLEAKSMANIIVKNSYKDHEE